METKHENRFSQGNDGILSNQALRANKVDSCGNNSTKRVRTNCNKIKSGYNGATKVNSSSHHQHGDVTMNNNTDTKLEMMQVKVDSSEKVISAGLAGHKAELAGHKAELEGYKSHADGKFEATIAQMDADRRVAEANNKAMLERMDADRKAVDARMDAERNAVDARMDADRKAADARHESLLKQIDVRFEAVRTEIKESSSNLKVWIIITGIGIASAMLAAWRYFMGS